MKKNGINRDNNYGNSVSTANERSSYHNPPSSNSSQDKKCDSCRYRVPINECTTFKCKDCGSYIVSDMRSNNHSKFELCRSAITVIKIIWKKVALIVRRLRMKTSQICNPQ
jgi:predicted RNA-binding Zn-ribbon protein involved in translation (DUF1610 family)